MISVGPTFSFWLDFILVVLLYYFKLSPPTVQYNKLGSTLHVFPLVGFIFVVLLLIFYISTVQYTHQSYNVYGVTCDM